MTVKRYISMIGFYLILALCLLFGTFSNAAYAEEDPLGFSYKINYPDNHQGERLGYYDILLDQGQKQTVELSVTNLRKSKIKVNVSLNGAKTNANGIIEYGESPIENDKSLKFPFEKLVSAPESIEIEGEATAQLPITIQMPKTSFEGMVLGGIQLQAEEKDDEQAVKGQGATVKNSYAYVISMVLKQKPEKVAPEIVANKAYASQQNYRNTIGINLSNVTGSLIKNKMSIEAQITKKGSDEVLYERKQTGMSIAPNSQIDFPVQMNGELMVVGDYVAKVLVMIDDQRWEKSLDFKITREEADKYNKRDVGLVQNRGIDVKLVILIVVGVLIVAGAVFAAVKYSKNKQAKAHKTSKTKRRIKRRK